MGLLWHQGAQYRNQFGGRDVVESNDLRDVFVATNSGLILHDRNRRGPRIFAGHNTNHLPASHRGIALHVEYRKEQIVKLGLCDGLRRDHPNFTLHIGIHHHCGARNIRDELDEFLNVGVLQVHRVFLRGSQRTPCEDRHSDHRLKRLPENRG